MQLRDHVERFIGFVRGATLREISFRTRICSSVSMKKKKKFFFFFFFINYSLISRSQLFTQLCMNFSHTITNDDSIFFLLSPGLLTFTFIYYLSFIMLSYYNHSQQP